MAGSEIVEEASCCRGVSITFDDDEGNAPALLMATFTGYLVE
jgi:hypothetical protein